jgi:hypothetical protein
MARFPPSSRYQSGVYSLQREASGTGPQTGTQPPLKRQKPHIQAESLGTDSGLENRFTSFRRIEGSNLYLTVDHVMDAMRPVGAPRR